jgi:hypothetical protein
MAKVTVPALGFVMAGILTQAALADDLLPMNPAANWLMWGNAHASAPSAPPTPQPVTPADAFINLGLGPYPEASLITTGNAQPWYDSTQITRFFGGQQPTAQQQTDFGNAILQRVEQTFSQSGVPITLTDNPAVQAAHTLSLVSNTSAAPLADAIGMTELGQSGFSFIDKIAGSAQSLDQLEWIVAHNISHELMLAFGVGENYDHTGNYIDAPVANWAMMTSPGATFSSAAAQALQAGGLSGQSGILGAQVESAQNVPEPATAIVWLVALGALVLVRR